MDEHIENAANSGVLYIGEAGKSFREHYEWLKWYYDLRGFRFCDVRQHVLSTYDHMLDRFTFRDIFIHYTSRMVMHHREWRCKVVNDNDEHGACCAAPYVRPTSFESPRHVYPLVKYHPMSAFLGIKPPRFGYFTTSDLIDRLENNHHG